MKFTNLDLDPECGIEYATEKAIQAFGEAIGSFSRPWMFEAMEALIRIRKEIRMDFLEKQARTLASNFSVQPHTARGPNPKTDLSPEVISGCNSERLQHAEE